MAIYWASSWKVGERVPLEGRKGRRVGTGRGREGEGTTGTEGREESMSWGLGLFTEIFGMLLFISEVRVRGCKLNFLLCMTLAE